MESNFDNINYDVDINMECPICKKDHSINIDEQDTTYVLNYSNKEINCDCGATLTIDFDISINGKVDRQASPCLSAFNVVYSFLRVVRTQFFNFKL